MGTIYLIHFDVPFKHARHYLGWSSMLSARLDHHRNGTGSRLMAAVTAAGIAWRVVRTIRGDRHLESLLKRRGENVRMCPVCTKNPKYSNLEPGKPPDEH